MKRYHFLIAILAVALAASACVKLGGKPVDKRYYQIAPARTAEKAAAPKHEVLNVRRLSISDLYNTRELVYRGPEGRIDSDYYNLLFVNPADMLTVELRRWLRESGLFAHVIEPGSLAVPGLTLEGVVNALYGDYSGTRPQAVVEMQFFLVDESTAENDIVFSADYTQRIPIETTDAPTLIQAMTRGVQAIFTALETDLAAVPEKR